MDCWWTFEECFHRTSSVEKFYSSVKKTFHCMNFFEQKFDHFVSTLDGLRLVIIFIAFANIRLLILCFFRVHWFWLETFCTSLNFTEQSETEDKLLARVSIVSLVQSSTCSFIGTEITQLKKSSRNILPLSLFWLPVMTSKTSVPWQGRLS